MVQRSLFTKQLVLDCTNAAFLRDTVSASTPCLPYLLLLIVFVMHALIFGQVIEDTDLILLEGSCDVISRARSLAALGLLTGKSQGDLLVKLLDCSEVVIEVGLVRIVLIFRVLFPHYFFVRKRRKG